MALSVDSGLGPAPANVASLRNRWGELLAYIGSTALCLLILPNFYAWIVVITSGRHVIERATADHIIANCFANLLVVVAAFYSSGRFDQKLAYVANSAMRAHGLLALVVVLTHSAYSNWVMISAMGVSGVVGAAVALVKHRTRQARVALVGDAEVLSRQVGFVGERVSDPTADLRRYDVLLTPYPGEMPSAWARATTRAMLQGKRVRHAAEYLEETQGLTSLEHFDLDQLPIGGLAAYRPFKRALDIGLAAVALVVAAPVIGLAALAILATMGGPILFIQSRTGLGGRPFRIIKLRTMRAGDGVGQVTLPDDQRVTRLGRWLRKLRIDELPQLLNVLAGQMSLVGPRPEWTVLADRYEAEIPTYAYRHLVRPGITGWAQVRAGYAADVAETKVKLAYDLFYLKYCSPALDLQILLRTALTVVTGRGAR